MNDFVTPVYQSRKGMVSQSIKICVTSFAETTKQKGKYVKRYQIISVTRAEFLLKKFCSEKSSGKVEEKFHRRKSKQFRQSHRTAIREVVGVHVDAMLNLNANQLNA